MLLSLSRNAVALKQPRGGANYCERLLAMLAIRKSLLAAA